MSKGTITIIGAYRLPFSIGLDEGCAGLALPTQVGGIPGEVILPRLAWNGNYASTLPPTPDFSARMAKLFHEGPLSPWGAVGVRSEVGHKVISWSMYGLLFRFRGIAASKVSHLDSVRGRGRPTGPLVDDLNNGIDRWVEAIGVWLDVLTDQDSGLVGPEHPVRVEGEGLNLWTIESDIESAPTTGGTIHIVVDDEAETLDSKGWSRLVGLATQLTPVPDEHMLIAEAKGWLRRGKFRRAVIDACTAAEMAMTRMLEAKFAPLDPDFRDRIEDEHRALMKLGTLTAPWSVISKGALERLATARNRAAHKNAAPTRDQAKEAVATATALVEAVEPSSQFQ